MQRKGSRGFAPLVGRLLDEVIDLAWRPMLQRCRLACRHDRPHDT